MKMNMEKWLEDVIASPKKKAMPILSFPSIQKMGISVAELIMSSDLQAEGIKLVADATDALAAVSYMDLSIEAEAFGSEIVITDDEVPTVVGALISNEEDAENLVIPKVGAKRTALNIEAIQKACTLITDRPVFAGVIGPFSLAGRLMDVSEAMIYCYEEPDMVHTVLEKVTEFIIDYSIAYKEAGAQGVVIAEPLAGLLSPDLAEEFSKTYMEKIVDALQDENFIVIYHNCGNTTIQTIDSIISNGCHAFHFGNAIDMEEMLKLIPEQYLVMGNVDPAGIIKDASPETVYKTTTEIMEKCCNHSNFVISSGCDIPPLAPWENIDAFFKAVSDFYQ